MIISFSQKFLKGHPKVGKPTYFVEKILTAKGVDYTSSEYLANLGYWNAERLKDGRLTQNDLQKFIANLDPKFKEKIDYPHRKITTCRGGSSRMKKGQKFDAVVWSGKPYCSPMIIFLKDVEVEQVSKFEMIREENGMYIYVDKSLKSISQVYYIAINDGLPINDFLDWFNIDKGDDFKGQIVRF